MHGHVRQTSHRASKIGQVGEHCYRADAIENQPCPDSIDYNLLARP
jgi:hypothetical protein